MKKMLCLTLLVTSFQIFAANKVQSLLETNSEFTPYEILEQFHNSEGTPASLTDLNFHDFDRAVTINRFQNCVAASVNSRPFKTSLWAFSKEKVIPAVPANGPLFPGRPEIQIPRTGLTLNLGNVLNTSPFALDKVLDNSFWEQDETRGTIFSQKSGFSIEGDNFNYVTIKKHDALLSFYAVDLINNAGSTLYGYCWNE